MKTGLAILAGLSVAFSAPVTAQEKKQLPKGQKEQLPKGQKEQPAKGKKKAVKKPVPKKQAASVPNNDWSRFNTGAQKDLDDLEKKKKAGK